MRGSGAPRWARALLGEAPARPAPTAPARPASGVPPALRGLVRLTAALGGPHVFRRTNPSSKAFHRKSTEDHVLLFIGKSRGARVPIATVRNQVSRNTGPTMGESTGRPPVYLDKAIRRRRSPHSGKAQDLSESGTAGCAIKADHLAWRSIAWPTITTR